MYEMYGRSSGPQSTLQQVQPNGEFRPRQLADLQGRVAWAQAELEELTRTRPELVAQIKLDARKSKLGAGYEAGNVVAFDYPIDAIPQEQDLERDLRYLVALLGRLYLAAERTLQLPGDPAPEVADAVTAVEQAAGHRPAGQGFRLSAAERRAIEERAVLVAAEHLTSQNFTVKDVGATKSYDLDARRGQEHLYVEVKGTTSSGCEVILTRAEVELHRREHPCTMLVVVSGIRLDRDSQPPAAGGGDLQVLHPWQIERAALTPIAYRYTVPVTK